jgi:DNA-binding response OmpR family regulator
MRAVDQIGNGMPQTLPAAHAEIRRLRELARDWLAFGGEVEAAQEQVVVRRLASALGSIVYWNKRHGSLRSSARVLLALCSRPEFLWERQPLLAAADAMLSFRKSYDDYCDFKIVDVYVCNARKCLRAMGFPNGIETLWGRGYLIRADAAQAVLKLAGAGEGRRA